MTRERYIEARIQRTVGCWVWTGGVGPSGYGVAARGDGRRTTAHRLVYEVLVGSIPEGMQLDHLCHNRDESCPGGKSCLHRRCVNPAHVEPVSSRVNVRRGKTRPALNLAKTTCPEGHEYDRVSPRGWRSCSVCALAAQERRRRARGVPESRNGAQDCAHGHRYTPESTRWSNGKRYCKTCDRARAGVLNPLRPRKPCRGCGGPKEPGKARAYCDACQPQRYRRSDPPEVSR